MWFFSAVLVLWAATVIVGRQDEAVLPPVVQWGIWTMALYAPGVAAIEESWQTLHAKVLGVFGYVLLTAYYTTQMSAYLALLPTDADQPDLWPAVFLSVNLVGPLAVATYGCVSPAVQRR